MPTIQSASERDLAASSSRSNSSAGRNLENASFIAALVIEFSHSRFTGFLPLAFSYRYAKISSPSRPASQALTTSPTSSRPSCLVTTDICFARALVAHHQLEVLGHDRQVGHLPALVLGS